MHIYILSAECKGPYCPSLYGLCGRFLFLWTSKFDIHPSLTYRDLRPPHIDGWTCFTFRDQFRYRVIHVSHKTENVLRRKSVKIRSADAVHVEHQQTAVSPSNLKDKSALGLSCEQNCKFNDQVKAELLVRLSLILFRCHMVGTIPKGIVAAQFK